MEKQLRFKAPVVLEADASTGYETPVVWMQPDGTQAMLYTANGADGPQLFICGSRDDRRWNTGHPLQTADGLQLTRAGSGCFWQGAWYFCAQCAGKAEFVLVRSAGGQGFSCVGQPIPFSGPVPALAADPQKPEYLWRLDCTDGAVWFRTQNGADWEQTGAAWEANDACAVKAMALALSENESTPLKLVLTAETGGEVCAVVREASAPGAVFDAAAQKPLRLDWKRLPNAAAFGGVASAFWDASLALYRLYYHVVNADGKGSICLAVSRDLVHCQAFARDQATYPENGVIYEGDYYRALPFSEYIRPQTLLTDAPVFDIRDYGAIPDGATLNTEAIRAAAEAARDAGGGIVLVAGGHYCTGTVQIYSGTTLWIVADSALCASKDMTCYEDAFLKFVDAQDVTLCGGGKVIGNGEYFTYLPLKRPLTDPLPVTKLPPYLYDAMGYPVDTIRYAYRSRIRYAEDKYGEGLPPIPRPMYMVWVRGCSRVHIENIIIEDSLEWTLGLDNSETVTVRDLVINDNRHVANTDGIDIIGSRGVEIDHCFISCADDGICIKAPGFEGHDGLNVKGGHAMGPARDIHVQNCTVQSVMNCFKIGTETYFDVENVTVENCRFALPDIYPGAVSGISIESIDGGYIRNIRVRNIEMEKVCCPVFVCLNKRNKFGYLPQAGRERRDLGGRIEQVVIENVHAEDMEVPCIITGYAAEIDGQRVERRVNDIRIRNFFAAYRDNKEDLDIRQPVCENVTDYPENNAFGDVPAYGFYVRHADGVALENCTIIPRTVNTRPCIVREQ